MKTLVLLRHAKTEKATIGISDHQRSLTPQGEVDARNMAMRLKKKMSAPVHIISSSALRAKQTAIIFADVFQTGRNEIIFDTDLYLASATELLDFLKSTSNKIETLILVNHNPAISELSNYLSQTNVDMPTCSFMMLLLNIDDWKKLKPDAISNGWFQFPLHENK